MPSTLTIGLIVAAIVIIVAVVTVVVAAVSKTSPQSAPVGSQASIVAPTAKWAAEANTNYVYGMVNPMSGSDDGNVAYLGIANSSGECQSLCATKPLASCGGYTWRDADGGAYANQCFGLKTVGLKVAESGHQSATRSEGFCPNLLQRAGMCNAGERFENDTLRGTFDMGRPQTISGIPTPY